MYSWKQVATNSWRHIHFYIAVVLTAPGYFSRN
jgi:hypothetical protein